MVNVHGSYAFGKLYTSELHETAVDVYYDRVLRFYESQGIKVKHILTDNGREYCGRAMIHPYQIFLELYDIKHYRTKVATPRTNGFWNASIALFWMSSSGKPSARDYIPQSNIYRLIWINGWIIIANDLIEVIEIWVNDPLKPSKPG